MWKKLAGVLGLLLLLGVCPQIAHTQSTPTLLVFVPEAEDARALQTELSVQLTGIEVTVLGRAKDLKKQLAAMPQTGVLAPVPVLKDLGLSPSLYGLLSGKDTSKVSIVRMGKTGGVIGILDLLGRKAMPQFVTELLGDQTVEGLQVKRVRKNRDLRSLLLLHQADAVILRTEDAALLVENLGAEASAKELKGPGIGLPALGANGDVTEIAAALRNLSASSLRKLGLDAWK